MKALVLAGGAGTRLRPLTYTSAKQLIPVANKPVLFYGLEAIRDVGITDVGIVVGDTEAAIRSAVGDGSALRLSATYIRQEAPLGLAHAVLVARDFLAEDDFVMYLGDNFIVGGITPLVAEFRAGRPDAQIMLTRVPDPRQFGVAELDGAGQVIGLEEKPARPKSDLALVGVYMFTPAVHEAVRQLRPSWRNELEITEAIQWLIDAGRTVTSTLIAGYWKDTGNVTDMLEVNRLVLESLEPSQRGTVDDASELIGRVVIGEGAKVTGSRIVGPVIIGSGTSVTSSYIGPFSSVAEDCDIADSEIEYSIVVRGAHGLNLSITRCCNNYGPYQYPEKVIPLFITNLLDGRKVPLYGDGGNVRGWIHVDDHCRGIQLVAERGQPGAVYHINGDAELTNLDLTRALLECCGAGWDMVAHVEDRKGHDRRYSLGDSALRALGYAPRTPFEDGLKETVRWYEENRAWWEPLKQPQPAR
jgi:glucose-1-phosphate thymidylyltransferase